MSTNLIQTNCSGLHSIQALNNSLLLKTTFVVILLINNLLVLTTRKSVELVTRGLHTPRNYCAVFMWMTLLLCLIWML